MTGLSTGSAYTLLSASLMPEITCVIPVVPYDHILEGSVYTWHGDDIPYTPAKFLDMGMIKWFRSAKKAKGYGLARFMRYGYDQ